MKNSLAQKLFIFTVAATLIAGCATQRINWNSRVGSYNFDQAITEFGPPDKRATLSDGKLVAEWITRYNSGGTVVIGTGFYGYRGGVGVMQSTGPSYYESKLRLIFNTNNILAAWSKN
jgi:hypothetical protein